MDRVERSQSPRKVGSLEDVSKDRKAQGQRDPFSSSPRKGSKREQDPAVPFSNAEEPQSPRRPAGQQPGAPSGEERRYRQEEEDAAAYRPAESGDRAWGSGERQKKGKRAEQEASVQKSSSQTHRERERAGSDADNGTLSRRAAREKGEKEHREGKDPRGSSSSIHQDPSVNGTSASKKAPITPGPWKVPSSAKIQSQVDASYADV